MLLINTIIKPSLITNAGKGLFTTEDIKKSQPIWKKDITDIGIIQLEYEELKKLNLVDYIHKYATEEDNGNWFMDGDSAIYTNHSFTPNVLFLDYIGVAFRDIAKGEEITCDYTRKGFTSEKHLKQLMNEINKK